MRTELREVTVQQEVYVAYDGTEFNSRSKCEDYEIECLEKNLKCYGKNFEKSNVEECLYVDLTTEEDVKNFKQISEYLDISCLGIEKPGLYLFVDDYRDVNWIYIDEVISKIRG